MKGMECEIGKKVKMKRKDSEERGIASYRKSAKSLGDAQEQ